MTSDSPREVDELYAGVTRLLDLTDPLGRRAGDCTRGVYLFIDYDDEPIYVGQTTEKLRTRIRRHLTNQRTDAVAMRVLDPFEVAEVEMWPFWDLEGRDVGDTLDRAEYTVYQQALAKSKFRAVLNEGVSRRRSRSPCRRQYAARSCPTRPVRAANTPTFASLAAPAPSLTWPASSASDK